MRIGRTDRTDDAFTHTGNNGLFHRPTDEPLEIGAYGNSRLHFQLNPVFSNRIERLPSRIACGAVDHLRIDTGLDRLQNIATGEVNRRGLLEIEINDFCFNGSNAGPND